MYTNQCILQFAILLLLQINFVVCKAQLQINDIKPHIDTHTGIILYCIPDSIANTIEKTKVNITSDSAWTKVCLNGIYITNNDSIYIDFATNNKSVPLTAIRSDGSEASYKVCFTTLPIVHLYGTFSSSYSQGSVDICDPNSKEQNTNMNARIKWRGATTNSAGKNKRNYHIKFLKSDGTKMNRSFFNFRKDNDWLLDAAQIDFVRCRNAVLTQLWRNMATQPYYIKEEPTAKSYVRSVPVELFLNNEYMGIYHFGEAMDAKQLALTDYDNILKQQHGLLYKTISWTTAVYMGMYSDTQPVKDLWQGYEIKHPDPDDTTSIDFTPLQKAIHFVATTDEITFQTEVNKYFDVPVLIDYYIFMHITMAVDNAGKNIYWACYDTKKDPRFTLAVWDLDATMGQWPDPSDAHPEKVGPTVNFEDKWNPHRLFVRLWENPYFNKAIINRYKELRQTVINSDSIIEKFNYYIQKFNQSGATLREEERWSNDSDLKFHTLNINAELDYITEWTKNRINYLDNNIFNYDYLPVSLPKENKENSSIYSLDGIKKKNNNITRGIYIINKKKVIK